MVCKTPNNKCGSTFITGHSQHQQLRPVWTLSLIKGSLAVRQACMLQHSDWPMDPFSGSIVPTPFPLPMTEENSITHIQQRGVTLRGELCATILQFDLPGKSMYKKSKAFQTYQANMYWYTKICIKYKIISHVPKDSCAIWSSMLQKRMESNWSSSNGLCQSFPLSSQMKWVG